jgi:putative acetyltransferase
MDSPVVRPEGPADRDAIDALLEAAFGGRWEADLVRRLRDGGALAHSLVAATGDGAIVGHVAFSPLPIATDGGPVAALALAPLAVAPWRRRQGVGSLLVRAGRPGASDAGAPLVVALGDPAYYGRFGFRAEAAAGLRRPFAGAALQGLALHPGWEGIAGEAAYHPAFFAA